MASFGLITKYLVTCGSPLRPNPEISKTIAKIAGSQVERYPMTEVVSLASSGYREGVYCDLNVQPQKIYVEFNLMCDGIMRWSFWEKELSHEGRAHTDGLKTL